MSNIYYNRQVPGELWLRDLQDNIFSSTEILSSVYEKYSGLNSTFFSELTSNDICRFDIFYDSMLLETNSGYIFEKFYTENNQLKPYTQLNLFNSTKTTRMDYWFDERKNKIYIAELYWAFNLDIPEKCFDFILIFKSFNRETGQIKNEIIDIIRLSYTESINWNEFNLIFTMENPKITYNFDTKKFNVSFVLRNSVNEMGIVSINIDDKDSPKVLSVDGFLPYFNIDKENCKIIPLNTIPLSQDYSLNYLMSENSIFLTTEFSEYLLYDSFVI